jgi:hypothetical protein
MAHVIKIQLFGAHRFDDSTGIRGILPAPLPLLKSLHLDINSSIQQSTAPLNGVWDHLIELSLNRAVPANPPAFRRLKRLRLQSVYCPNNDYSIIPNFLNHVPLLEVLELNCTVSSRRIAYHQVSNLVELFQETPPIPLPHLRVLKIIDDYFFVFCLLQILPHPSQMLTILVNPHQSEGQLQIPFVRRPSSYEELVFDRVTRIWNSISGQSRLPDGRLQLSVSGGFLGRISCGTLHSIDTPTPSMFYAGLCRIEGPDPLLDMIQVIELELEDFPLPSHVRTMYTPENRLQVLDHFADLRRIAVKISCGS